MDDDDFGRGGGAYGEVDEVGGVEGGVEDLGVLVGFELIRHMQWYPPPRITRNNIPQPPPHPLALPPTHQHRNYGPTLK